MESIQNFFKNLWEKFKAWVEANPRRAAIWGGAIALLIIGFFIPVDTPHVALSGEAIFSAGPSWLTNSMITTVIVDIVLILLAVAATARMSLVPKGFQNFMEFIIEALYGLAESVAGSRARQFFPWVATLFFFVLLSNYSGLIPGVGSIGYYHYEEGTEAGEHAQVLDAQLAMAGGQLLLINDEAPLAQAATPEAEEEHGEEAAPEGEEHGEEGAAADDAHHGPKFIPLFRAPSADLNMTFALAISTMVMVQIWGVRTLGGSYFKKFVNTSGTGFMKGINIFVGVLEIISEFSRILAFGFRLFGNIFAGEIVLATMAFLVTFFLPMPFYALELFVGFVQALVFMMLTLVFFTMSTISHGDHHDDHGDHGETHAVEAHAAAH